MFIALFCFACLFKLFGLGSEQWEPTEFIWNLGLSAQTDKGLPADPRAYFKMPASFDTAAYRGIQSGDAVWLKACFVERFCQDVLKTVEHPFVVVITDGDESFPSNCGNIDALIESDKVLHVFAQNCDYRGPSRKVSHLPIGIDFHSIAYKGKKGMWGEKGSPREQEATLTRVLKSLQPTHQRLKRAYVDFHHSDTMHGNFQRYLQFGEDRKSIFERLLSTGFIDHGQPMRRKELWKRKGQYAFSVSPHGNGLDCHRTWEDLALGCIVIVKHSPLDPLYAGLPVVIVQDWSEITEANMDQWLQQYGDAFTNPRYREKLTNRYWMARIRAACSQIPSADR